MKKDPLLLLVLLTLQCRSI